MELRPDIAAAAEKMIARDRVGRELRQLAASLHKDEVVQRLSSGTYPAGHGLLAITDQRVIALRQGRAGPVGMDFPLNQLSTADWSPGLFAGKITFADPASGAQLGHVELAEGKEIVQLIRARMGAGADTRWRAWFSRRKAVGANAGRTFLERWATSFGRRPAPARSDDELDTQILVPVSGRRIGEFGSPTAQAGAHRVRHRADPHPRNPVWPVAAAAALIGLVCFGSYRLLSEHAGTPYATDASELAAMNVAPPPATPAVGHPTNAVVGVVRVIDADSFEAAGGANGPVEVIGIQAPGEGECGAEASASFAMSKLNGTAVTLVTDPTKPGIDAAGRLLAQVKLADGTDYAVLAARAGMVKYFKSSTPDPQADQIKAAQLEAQRSHTGLWGSGCHGSGA
jgi:endonuclease YncB( thermonuclease family)